MISHLVKKGKAHADGPGACSRGNTQETLMRRFDSFAIFAKLLRVTVAPHSSSGLGHRPLKAEIEGSNPSCGTL